MPLLPQPDTASPGALQLLYRVGAVDHVTSANILDDADFSDIAAWRTEAMDFAEAAIIQLTNISTITAWRLVNTTGVSLYEEDFAVPYVGSRGMGPGEFAAESCSISLTGKGTPPIGYEQGQTRTTIFVGTFDPVNWTQAKQVLDAGTVDFGVLRDYLVASTRVGADHYGTKATYRNYMCPQLNAHYQKKYGV